MNKSYKNKLSVLSFQEGTAKKLLALITICNFFSMSECVLRLPEFTEPIKNGTLPVGSDVEFSCDVRHLGTYRVAWSWRKGDEQKFLGIGIVKIVSDSRVHISRIQKSDDVTQFNLYIYNIRKDDAGTYHCSVNSNPMIEQIGTLDVTGEEYANGHNGKIVNGKSVINPRKPVRKGSIDSSSASLGTAEGQHDTIPNSPGHKSFSGVFPNYDDIEIDLNSTNRTSYNGTVTRSDVNDNSTLFCFDLSGIWERAWERVSNFLSSLMKLTYSYLFS